MLAARVVGLFLSTGLAVTLGSGGTGGGTLQLVRTVPADMASEVPTDIVVTAEFDNQGVALAMGSCGVTALRLGTGISKESAIRAARIYAQGNGWPWEEPIFVEEGVFRIRIMTAADRLGGNVHVTVSARDGSIVSGALASTALVTFVLVYAFVYRDGRADILVRSP